MIRVTDNKEVKETVLAGLKHNKDKYGKRYCPCSLIRDEISYLARISRGHHVDTLLVPREYKDTFKSTELYEILLPNISIGDVQFAKIYYYD